ncbi:efflux RND transporter permease subunit [Methylocystis parvus]|uniref:efflux RND transporter permease subunit n=1 Tax=Methylocystis parvus TaxID=134 RepID=UPI003C74237C
MRFPHFFIERPIFAAVLSVLLTIAGLIAQRTLPIAEYPDIAPPTVAMITPPILAPRPKSSPRPLPRRSSRRSTASTTCSTSPRNRRATAC